MNAEKISELEKKTAVLEVSLNRALNAVEKQASSTERLTNSVTEMTSKLSTNTDETKELRAEVKQLNKGFSHLTTEIAVIKRGNRWQEVAEKAVIVAIMGAVFWALGAMP